MPRAAKAAGSAGKPRGSRSSQQALRYCRNIRAVHDKECQVCVSPLRQHIEQMILDWHAAGGIAQEFGLPEIQIRAHGYVLGLFKARENDRKGVYRELVRTGMERIQTHKRIDIKPRDVIAANDSLVRMEGGFKDNLDVTSKGAAVGNFYGGMTREQLLTYREKMMGDLSNPNAARLQAHETEQPVIDIPALDPASGQGSSTVGPTTEPAPQAGDRGPIPLASPASSTDDQR